MSYGKNNKPETIFEPDELEIVPLKNIHSPEQLFALPGLVYLKDILEILNIHLYQVKRAVAALESEGRCPWKELGIRKVWNHWIVRLKVFAKYYNESLKSSFRLIPKDMDGNLLMEQKGIFLLSDVCRLIPFKPSQIRYQAKRMRDPRIQIGVWKDPAEGQYLVEMEKFSKWIRKMWYH